MNKNSQDKNASQPAQAKAKTPNPQDKKKDTQASKSTGREQP
ncbi:MAG: hypothetical protein RR216_05520 [Pseudoflavonifractor sp.]